jgi:hypothetical protein
MKKRRREVKQLFEVQMPILLPSEAEIRAQARWIMDEVG